MRFVVEGDLDSLFSPATFEKTNTFFQNNTCLGNVVHSFFWRLEVKGPTGLHVLRMPSICIH